MGLGDASGDARAAARSIFGRYAQLFSDEAAEILRFQDSRTQKLLQPAMEGLQIGAKSKSGPRSPPRSPPRAQVIGRTPKSTATKKRPGVASSTKQTPRYAFMRLTHKKLPFF